MSPVLPSRYLGSGCMVRRTSMPGAMGIVETSLDECEASSDMVVELIIASSH